VRRGDVYLADLNPVKGSEQAGRRPVLVLQRDSLNAVLPTVVIAPFTSTTKRAATPSCHLVPAGEGGLTMDSVLMCHQSAFLMRPGWYNAWALSRHTRLMPSGRSYPIPLNSSTDPLGAPRCATSDVAPVAIGERQAPGAVRRCPQTRRVSEQRL
jgi:mRNA interferase MazF